jgi:phytoene desaturase
MQNNQLKAVVIGAGFGGLAAALRLRALGYSVTVIDKLDGAGGRARTITRQNKTLNNNSVFEYDAGPTVLTAPILFEELFALFGENLHDFVKLLPVKPWYRMQFNDGKTLDYGGNTANIQAEIAKFSQVDADNYPKFLAHTENIFKVGYEKYGDKPFSTWRNMFSALPHLIRYRADRSVYDTTAHFFKNDSVRRAFSIQPLLVGGNPFNTTSIYSLIHFLERKWGIWYPQGGMRALVQGLVDCGKRHGIDYQFNQTVTSLGVQNGAVNAVNCANGETLLADIVATNADPAFVYENWLNGTPKPLLHGHYKHSMSLFVWYFSTKKIYQDVQHHTILFGEAYRETLNKIFNTKVLDDDISIYLHRPAATDPTHPADHDSFYALVPVPNLSANIDWAAAAPTMRKLLSDTLQAKLLPNLEAELVDDYYITPRYFETELQSVLGASFGIQPTFFQSAKFRYQNKSAVNNLYFVGANTHPGAGVPGVVLSAKVLENILKSKLFNFKPQI